MPLNLSFVWSTNVFLFRYHDFAQTASLFLLLVLLSLTPLCYNYYYYCKCAAVEKKKTDSYVGKNQANAHANIHTQVYAPACCALG